MQVSKRIFVLFITCWLLICQSGLAWSISTCLYTGSKKVTIGKNTKCCKMPSRFSKEGSKSNLLKKPCCKIEQHAIKLSADFEKKVVEKKVFQSFIRKIVFLDVFFSKTIVWEKILIPVQKSLKVPNFKHHASFLQIFLI